MRRANTAYKPGELPMRAIERVGRRAAALGASRALLGHFHHDRLLDVPSGVPVRIAPAWLDHRLILVGRPADGALVSVTAAAARDD